MFQIKKKKVLVLKKETLQHASPLKKDLHLP
jgi:hypothetical protein